MKETQTQEQYNPSEREALLIAEKNNAKHKFFLILLVFFSMFIIFAWSFGVKNIINKPFEKKYTNQNNEIINNFSNPQDKLLQSIDTDGDGLNDWDEVNVYNTSPYIVDSDSDGYSDLDEVKSGNNPVCATGTDCGTDGFESVPRVTPDVQIGVPGQDNLSGEATDMLSETKKQIFEEMLGGKSNAESLRKIFIEAGMDKEILDQISDEDLLDSYRQILGETTK